MEDAEGDANGRREAEFAVDFPWMREGECAREMVKVGSRVYTQIHMHTQIHTYIDIYTHVYKQALMRVRTFIARDHQKQK